MDRKVIVHRTLSLIKEFQKDTSLTPNEMMLLRCLPHKVQKIIWELHRSMRFPISYCFSSIITAVSGAIANSKAVFTNNGYVSYPGIFMAIIGESGENKSQPIRWFMKPMWKRAGEMMREYNKELDNYLKETAKGNFDVEKPNKTQFIIQDATMEALKELLYENPRGVMVVFDELISWIRSFTRYKNGTASEQGEWIVIYDGDPLVVNRKGNARALFIEQPFVSLIGSIQPYVLCDAFKGIGTEDGLLWRILMTYPEHPACPIPWNDTKPNEDLMDEWSEIILSIFEDSLKTNYDSPKQIRYTDSAWGTIKTWQNMKEDEYTSFRSQKEVSVWRKVQINVNKIAICLKELWRACGEDVSEIGNDDRGDLPTNEDPQGNGDFIGMQMAMAATQIMDYYLENALQTLEQISHTFPKALLPEQKNFLKLFPLDGFISRNVIIAMALEKGMKQRTADRYLSQMKGTFLDHEHGKYKLSESGKMAIWK